MSATPAGEGVPGAGFTGYNLINTFSDRCAASGVLAGFAIAVAAIVVAVGSASAHVVGPVRFRDVGAGLIGLSAVLFLVSLEYFLSARENNPWDLPEKYEAALARDLPDFTARLRAMSAEMARCEAIGRHAYNFAIFALFVGLFFALYPFSPGAAVLVAGVGIGFEVYQMWPTWAHRGARKAAAATSGDAPAPDRRAAGSGSPPR